MPQADSKTPFFTWQHLRADKSCCHIHHFIKKIAYQFGQIRPVTVYRLKNCCHFYVVDGQGPENSYELHCPAGTFLAFFPEDSFQSEGDTGRGFELVFFPKSDLRSDFKEEPFPPESHAVFDTQ